MAFQIKDFKSIVASMVNHIRATTDKLTDFSVGSVTRTMIEAPAIELDQYYQQMFNGLREAIPAAVYPPFGFALLPPQAAAVNVIFSLEAARAQPVVIPAEFAVRQPNGLVQYLTQAQAVIAAGETSIPVRVVADTIGVAGNAVANSITQLVQPIKGVSVTNPSPVVSGRDQETDDERFSRFQAFIRSIARSHLDGIQYGATTARVVDANGTVIETVRRALVVEPFKSDPSQPLGYLTVYIWNGVDSATPELLANVARILNGYTDANGQRVLGYKGAGIVLRVLPVTESYLDVNLKVTPSPSYGISNVSSLIQSALSDYITALDIGQTFVVSKAIDLAMEIPGVYNVKIGAPTDDVATTPDVKLLTGAITVSVA